MRALICFRYSMNKAKIIALLMLTMTGAITVTRANSAEWFTTEGASCSGNQILGDAIAALTGGGVQPAGTSPNLFLRLSASDLNSFSGPHSEKISNVKTLDGTSSKNLRELFLSRAEKQQVPFFATYGSGIFTALTLPGPIGTAADIAFSYLFSKLDANAATIREAGLLIADGGEIYNRQTLLQRANDENLFIVASTEYRVHLGNELRSFVVLACVYPISVTVKEFETVAPLANPRFPHILKLQPDGKWREWDTEDQRFIFEPRKYLYQTGGFYYFESDSMQNDRVVGRNRERISILGGGWQTMDYNAQPNGQWKNFYSKMAIR